MGAFLVGKRPRDSSTSENESDRARPASINSDTEIIARSHNGISGVDSDDEEEVSTHLLT